MIPPPAPVKERNHQKVPKINVTATQTVKT